MTTRQPGQSGLLLLEVVAVLDRENVGYAVIGAFALAALGQVRASTDADALLSVAGRRLSELKAVFERSGYETQLRQGGIDDPIQSLLVISDEFGNRVELLAGLKGMDPTLFARAFEISVRDRVLRIVGREDFIAMKCFAGGPQDILDARSAYQMAAGPIDLDLMRTIARRFGRDAADNLEQIMASS